MGEQGHQEEMSMFRRIGRFAAKGTADDGRAMHERWALWAVAPTWYTRASEALERMHKGGLVNVDYSRRTEAIFIVQLTELGAAEYAARVLDGTYKPVERWEG